MQAVHDCLRHERFQVLLPARTAGRRLFVEDIGFKACKIRLAIHDFLTDTGSIGRVPLFDKSVQLATSDKPCSRSQTQSEGVHASYMPNEQIIELEGSAAHLGVKVQSARLETTVLDDFHHRECGGVRISRHLVSIPAKKGVALVGVDAAQLPVDAAVAQLVLEGVTGKGRVVGFDIELEEGVEVVAEQEGKCVRSIEIILVLRRLEGLGFNEELPCEPDLVGVVDGHMEETRHIVLLQTIVCVEQGLVSLAATPVSYTHL